MKKVKKKHKNIKNTKVNIIKYNQKGSVLNKKKENIPNKIDGSLR